MRSAEKEKIKLLTIAAKKRKAFTLQTNKWKLLQTNFPTLNRQLMFPISPWSLSSWISTQSSSFLVSSAQRSARERALASWLSTTSRVVGIEEVKPADRWPHTSTESAPSAGAGRHGTSAHDSTAARQDRCQTGQSQARREYNKHLIVSALVTGCALKEPCT